MLRACTDQLLEAYGSLHGAPWQSLVFLIGKNQGVKEGMKGIESLNPWGLTSWFVGTGGIAGMVGH